MSEHVRRIGLLCLPGGVWLDLQSRWDLYHARRAEMDELRRISSL